MDEMNFSTEKGFIVYEKCGIIEIEKSSKVWRDNFSLLRWEIYSSSQKRN